MRGGCLVPKNRVACVSAYSSFSDARHTADELLLATKPACALMGFGAFIEGESPVDTVADFIHATTSDSASNIVCGWKSFDGHECNCRIIALAVVKYLESPGVGKEAVQLYDVEQPKKAATSVDNPDGSKYREHKLVGCEWDVVRESTYVLSQHADVIDLLQVAKNVTGSSVLPVIGGLISKLGPSRSLKYDGAAVVTNAGLPWYRAGFVQLVTGVTDMTSMTELSIAAVQSTEREARRLARERNSQRRITGYMSTEGSASESSPSTPVSPSAAAAAASAAAAAAALAGGVAAPVPAASQFLFALDSLDDMDQNDRDSDALDKTDAKLRYTGGKNEHRAAFIRRFVEMVGKEQRAHESRVRRHMRSATFQGLGPQAKKALRDSQPDYISLWDGLPSILCRTYGTSIPHARTLEIKLGTHIWQQLAACHLADNHGELAHEGCILRSKHVAIFILRCCYCRK
ncbi:hypothetical protein CYMTET_27641 [Cymbomonas tetramitiformis]|uniref:Uncharacterized protein n=1 Tax=Cymbomonas tetramitiformis TaxID=36881 RepID=A0AAE0FPW7_9CHLO|nr:hypothetical protein CYMTET_27641 [Cymbomonas tetramitiformis]